MTFDLSIDQKPVSRVYNCDCMEFMRTCKDKQFSLAIVDPEYGIGADIKNNINAKQSKKSATKSKKYGNQIWDKNIPNDDYFTELFRVTKNQIIWGANYFGLIGGYIYWNKFVTMPTYSDGELAYCSLINSVKQFDYAWHGMIQNDMKNKEDRIHPTQKPVALYKWLLKNYAKEGDKIFDSHMGSQSSRIACWDGGFDYWGTELDPDYFRDGCKRFENHIKQLKLL